MEEFANQINRLAVAGLFEFERCSVVGCVEDVLVSVGEGPKRCERHRTRQATLDEWRPEGLMRRGPRWESRGFGRASPYPTASGGGEVPPNIAAPKRRTEREQA